MTKRTEVYAQKNAAKQAGRFPRVNYIIRATVEVRDYTGRVIGWDDEIVFEGTDLSKAEAALKKVRVHDKGARIEKFIDGRSCD